MLDHAEFVAASCNGKERFECKTHADRIARRKNRSKKQKAGFHSETYRCRTCGGFHVGSSGSWTNRRKRHVLQTKRERSSYEDLSAQDDEFRFV